MLVPPSLKAMRDQFMEDVAENTKAADKLLLLYLTAAFQLGKDYTLQALEEEVNRIVDDREDDDDE